MEAVRPAKRRRVFRTRKIEVTITPRGIVAFVSIAVFVLVVSFTLGIRVGREMEAADLRAIDEELPAVAKAPVAAPASAPEPPVVVAEPVATASAARAATASAAVVAAPVVAPPPIPFSETPPPSGFGLQLGAFPSRDEARAFLETHRDILAGAKVFLIPTEIPGRGTWYRVRIGVVKQRGDAEILRQKLPENLARAALVVSHK